jgi:hypothetical protein
MVLGDLVRSKAGFPNEAAHDLMRLLNNNLAVETPAERRMARLGFLLDLVSSGSGEFISSPAYDAARDAAGERGHEYPSAAELGRYYGGWLTALKAALRFHFEGGSARVASGASGGFRPGYDTQEIVNFYLRICVDLGLDPTAVETAPTGPEVAAYLAIVQKLRGSRRAVPSAGSILRAFGNWENLRARAAELWRAAPAGLIRSRNHHASLRATP